MVGYELFLSGNRVKQLLYPFIAGIIATLVVQYVVPLRHCPSNPLLSPLIRLRKKATKGQKLGVFEKSDHYGLEHRLLNLKTQPDSMWLNVGFWKRNPGSFETACEHLLEEILGAAGIRSGNSQKISVLEVGSGCCETALFMRRSLPTQLNDYVGITLNGLQAEHAKSRLQESVRDSSSTVDPRGFRINEVFKANAADPSEWSKNIHDTLREMASPQKGSSKYEKKGRDMWVLALDTLYHFTPSRNKLLNFTHRELGASLMATDIIISPNVSNWNLILLRILFYFLHVPWSNVLTEKQYTDMLVNCGYEKKDIIIRDITQDCFPGYDEFLKCQSQRWEEIGGSPAVFRPMRLMGRVAGWWARSDTIHECVIVARANSGKKVL